MDLYEKIAAIENDCFNNPWTREMIASEAENSLSMLSVEEIGGSAAGYALGRVIAGEGELLRIGTAECFRRRGIAEKLLTSLLEKMRERGGETCFLEVRSQNAAAVSLYKKLGFTQVGMRRGYYGDDDALVMRKEL
ncbi:MAG: ribosomal protein S18-alanine N-acetyltransferase [Oscillospiraceae bacterium]|nr:ribosomal protein S18-alanine N-acetyltransferase [Oscillospiraceae bacterium]